MFVPRLIDANALKESVMKEIRHYWNEGDGGYYLAEDVIPDIDNAPTVDAVSRGVHDQVRWERDVAIEQLESYGISLGEKADVVKVVRCKDCKHRGDEGACPMYHVEELEWDDDGYMEVDYVPHDYTTDDGFCDRGERKDNERKAD